MKVRELREWALAQGYDDLEVHYHLVDKNDEACSQCFTSKDALRMQLLSTEYRGRWLEAMPEPSIEEEAA